MDTGNSIFHDIREVVPEMWNTFKEEWGRSVLLFIFATSVYAVVGRWKGGMSLPASMVKEIGLDALAGLAFAFVYLFWRTPLVLRRRDKQAFSRKIEDLEKFMGSKEITWTLHDEPGKDPQGQFFYSGFVYNGDTFVGGARVVMSGLTREGSNKTADDMELRRRGGVEGPFDLQNGRKLEFDFAVGTPPERHPSWVCFVGHIEGNKIEKWAVTPGVYSFTLQLFGTNIVRRDCNVKVDVGDNGLLRIVSATPLPYPLTAL